MNEKLNPLLTAIEDPPIDEVQQWIRGRAFPEDKPLIDLSQALPSYPPAAELRNHMAELVVDPTICLLYTSPSPRDRSLSRMPSSA